MMALAGFAQPLAALVAPHLRIIAIAHVAPPGGVGDRVVACPGCDKNPLPISYLSVSMECIVVSIY